MGDLVGMAILFGVTIYGFKTIFGEPEDAKPKDAKPKDAKPKDAKPKDALALQNQRAHKKMLEGISQVRKAVELSSQRSEQAHQEILVKMMQHPQTRAGSAHARRTTRLIRRTLRAARL
jgi:hypothetical protein